MDFVGREEELEVLHGALDHKGFSGVVVYGRRRLGKTHLIQEAAKSFSGKVVYYQCLNSKVESENVVGLLGVAKLFFPDLLLSEKSSFQEILNAFFVLSKKEPICLILDEYPYLRNGDLTDSIIQALIDKYQNDSNLKLILCGSYVGIMEEVIDDAHPLYGRMDVKLKLSPFDYFDAAKMLPDASEDEKIRYYAVFGGVPYFLEKINTKEGFESNIKNLILRNFAPLESEILGGIEKEFKKIENASFLMDNLAVGKEKYLDLKTLFKDRTKGDFDYCLQTLMDMGLVTKRGSLNENEKKSYYQFGDNLYDFYYSCVHPLLQYRDVLPLDVFFERYVGPLLNTVFLPRKFEEICGQFLLRRNRHGLNKPLFDKIGRYVFHDEKSKRNGEFDLATEDPKGMVFYECKYWEKPVGLPVALEEERQLKACRLPYYRLGFFARNGFEENMKEKPYLLYSISDFFECSLDEQH
jgi:AAA+ ATPase superfamily predicted ATPase